MNTEWLVVLCFVILAFITVLSGKQADDERAKRQRLVAEIQACFDRDMRATMIDDHIECRCHKGDISCLGN